jgi:23S rRNA (adenine1618-N6)-methyltransferase
LHSKNIHNKPYDFKTLISECPKLASYVFVNDYNTLTIDFSDKDAVLQLNKAILKQYYGITDWNIPSEYLCPPIPGRADYIHHIADLLSKEDPKREIKGLDIGVGANCIYPILGSQIYGWKMVGVDIDITAVQAAQKNVSDTKNLKSNIEIRHQKNNAHIFEGIVKKGEHFHFSMCNPPFHASAEAAKKATLRKLNNLKNKKAFALNFGGKANELWCNGGEALFIKKMIKQSVVFKDQVDWFTSLVSKKENLLKIVKQLNKLKAIHQIVEMNQGNKQSRFIAWRFE